MRATRVVLAAALIAQLVWRADSSLTAESPVWDEIIHMNYGLNLLLVGPEVPPGDHPYPAAALLCLPLALSTPAPAQVLRWPRTARGAMGQVPRIEDPRNLHPARRMNVALAALGLALLGLVVGRRFGPDVGLLTVAIGSLDPGWIAPARYVITDIAQGLGFALAAFAALRDRETLGDPSPRAARRPMLLLAGLGGALALSAKVSGILVAPAVALVYLMPWRDGAPLRARLGRALVAGAAVAIMTVAGYCALLAATTAWTPSTLGDAAAHVQKGLSEFMRIRGIRRGTWLLGAWYPDGTWLYFPVLLLAKTPVALLGAYLAGLADPAARARLRAAAPLWAAPALFAAVAVVSRVNLGYRHLTPVLPFLWVVGAVGLIALWRRARAWRVGAVGLGALLVAEVALAHPHYLAWVNEPFGGVQGAHRVAGNATVDWGQDLPELASWLQAHPTPEPPHLAYFGKADPTAYGIDAVWRPCGELGRRRPREGPTAECDAPAGLLAISATCLHGAAGGPVQDPCWERLRGREPTAIIGGSILIFTGVE